MLKIFMANIRVQGGHGQPGLWHAEGDRGSRTVSPLQSLVCSIKNTPSIENFWSDKCASAS